MATLYELDRAICDVIERGFVVNEETGEILFEADDLEALQRQRGEKLEAIACFVKSLEADAAAIKNEESALCERRKAKERKSDRLRSYLASSLRLEGQERFESPRCSVSFRKSKSVAITDEQALYSVRPDLFKVPVAEPKPVKSEIKRAIEAGEEVPGAAIVEQQNLQVR